MLNKLRKGQISILGKSIPVFVIAALLMSGTVAALLTVYVTITGAADVAQSVVLTDCQLWEDGSDTCTGESHDPEVATFTISVFGGNTRDVGIEIKNNADIDADFDLTSTAVPDATITYYDDYDDTGHVCSGSEVTSTITIGSGVEQFYCVRYVWDIKATPVTGESITITATPA